MTMEALVSATSHDRPLLDREAALRRRDIRNGWIFVAVGLLIPFIALWGAWNGWTLREHAPRTGWSLLISGVAVFTVRLGLWIA
jgi:hypothetical protein